jgi:hypothetical protein
MSSNSSEVNRWLLVTALSALTSAAVWSTANLLQGGAVALDAPQGSLTQYEQLVEATDATDSVFAALKLLTDSIEKRVDIVSRVNLDTLKRSGFRASQRDSLIHDTYEASIAAAKDSARIASLRALPLPLSSSEVVRTAEQLAGAERNLWLNETNSFMRDRQKKKPTSAQIDSLFDANTRLSVALTGNRASMDRADSFYRGQLAKRQMMARQRLTRYLVSLLFLPVLVAAILVVLHFGRTGSWSLVDALGLRPAVQLHPQNNRDDG